MYVIANIVSVGLCRVTHIGFIDSNIKFITNTICICHNYISRDNPFTAFTTKAQRKSLDSKMYGIGLFFQLGKITSLRSLHNFGNISSDH